MQHSNGKLYITTYLNGANNNGTILQLDLTSNVIQKIYDFDPSLTGPNNSTLVEAPNGNLYGLTSTGGANNSGTIFEFDLTTNTLFKRFDFGGTAGSTPLASFIKVTSTKLIGSTTSGGTGNCGVLFEFDLTTNTYTKLFDFTQSLGKNPRCALTIHPNGKLYGTTYEGGSNNLGVLFEFDLSSNVISKKMDFSTSTGINPDMELIYDFAGNLYGLVYSTSDNNEQLFKYNWYSNSYSRILKFNASGGHYFTGGFTLAANGKYYGTTFSGVKHFKGALIEFDYNNNTVNSRVNFNDSTGFNSYSAILHASNNKIYGTTNNGGWFGYGSIFEYDYNNGVYTKKHDFIYTDGDQGMPGGMIMEASNGKIYGMRNGGGIYGLGTLYEFDIATDSFVVKLHFNDTLGAEPLGGLVQASNGKLYAGISSGGPSSKGLIIEYDINTDSVIIKKDYDATGVFAYNGTFIEVAPNKLYALSIIGGQNNEGALYEFDCITNQIAILYSFSAPTGCDPVGSLVYASNGKLYGSTKTRNVYDIGGLFEFDLTTGLYTHKLDWIPYETGWKPGFNLQEVGCIAPGILASGPVSFCQGDSVILSAFGSSSNSFQWHRNGNPIAGANSQNFTVKLPGKYSVSVTDTTCSLLFTSNPVRVRIPCIPPFDNQDKLSSTLTNADIFLNYDSQQQQFEIMATDLTAETYNLLIADATGRILLNENSGISNNSISRNVDCSALAKGLYIVKIIAGNKILSRKFVKER
ncbi:MAG: T9SS type A sorting domain-containing protein [Bacteroidetes bacterium]|nr:T9SS type A sorting domain-containing protein [Bacteroidota bacterium]